MIKSPKHFNIFALFLAILLGLFIYFPSIDYQLYLSQGDHGLNLYAAEAVTRGEIPYKDFHWFYGPLMPYYYASVFSIFGATIKSMLLGKAILTIISSLLVFLILSLNCSSSLALLGSLFFYFFQSDFFYTYNHIGGIALNLAAVYFLCLYLKTGLTYQLRTSFLFTLLLGMVKLNLGVTTLGGVILTILISKKFNTFKDANEVIKTSLTAFIMIPIGWIVSNGIFIYKLPLYIIKQGFQYFGNDAFAENYPSILENIYNLLHEKTKIIAYSPLDIFLCILFLAGIFFIFKNLRKKHEILIYLSCFTIFYIFQLHEYLISGVYFRSFWADSFLLLFVFTLIGYIEKNVTAFVRILIILFLITSLGMTIFKNTKNISQFKSPLSHFNYPKGNVYIGNNFEWKSTISKTIDFINNNLKKDELFFVAPYDPIYYFLTDRRSPTRQLAYFDFINIPTEQERTIIEELKSNHVNWIFLSNRVNSKEDGFGLFGQTNSRLIADYIKTNYEKVEEYGDWTKPAGWVTQTGMRIYRKKSTY